MKYIFSLMLVCSSYLSFGQMTVSEMMKVYNMDLDKFETYAITKGYQFDEVDGDKNEAGVVISNTFGHIYKKGKGKETKYITLYTTFFDDGKSLQYQTSNSNEYLKIKNQLIAMRFILESTDSFNGSVRKIYNLNRWNFSIFTSKSESGNEIFEINIKQK
jgi:hypothetical protein